MNVIIINYYTSGVGQYLCKLSKCTAGPRSCYRM